MVKELFAGNTEWEHQIVYIQHVDSLLIAKPEIFHPQLDPFRITFQTILKKTVTMYEMTVTFGKCAHTYPPCFYCKFQEKHHQIVWLTA